LSNSKLLAAEKQHLAALLEAIQRCVYFLNASSQTLSWPLQGEHLLAHKKDNDLFESLAAINERFAKLQDTLGAAMRHSLILSGERAESFMKVLTIFEKAGVVESIEAWQIARAARNLAAHDYDTDYGLVAAHFNALKGQQNMLFLTSQKFLQYAQQSLDVQPLSSDFSQEFDLITASLIQDFK
jgi:hypothetical protein